MSNWESPEVAKSICDAAENWGFFQIVNHGVPLEVLERVKEATHRFFALPAEEKRKYSKENSPTNKVRLGSSFVPLVEKALEWKDFLSLFYGSEEETSAFWPPVCKDETLEYMKSSEVLIRRLMHVLVKGLNVKRIDEIREPMLLGSRRVNLNYYPMCPNPELTVGVGRHSDISTFTILLQDDIGGLHVRKDSEQDFGPLFVNPKPEAILCPFPEVLANGEKPLYKPVLCADYSRHFYTKAHDGKKTIDFAKIGHFLKWSTKSCRLASHSSHFCQVKSGPPRESHQSPKLTPAHDQAKLSFLSLLVHFFALHKPLLQLIKLVAITSARSFLDLDLEATPKMDNLEHEDGVEDAQSEKYEPTLGMLFDSHEEMCGKSESKSTDVLKPKPIIKTSCDARIGGCVNKDGKWILRTLNLEHNHGLSLDKARYFPCNRNISASARKRIEMNDCAGINIVRNFNSIVVEAVRYENVSFLEKYCRNLVDKGRRLQL
ncbi:Feruloyl CoA ortho-hydroxylase 1 [Citrus sinensis]|uniref:Feruloyl CoA ortho-hydroxylase 1 n=1 Tax=Citrus sinensis TaxID=2711 RepID=A0ACB8MUA3_CITSI|nr:Feruloyl CoA ortho-hydroxylase 1 [Citrus sinensis]